MKYFFSLNKLALKLLGRLNFAAHSKNSVKFLMNVEMMYLECLEMSEEINSELNEAKVLLKEERLEKDILICYNKMFSSIYKKINSLKLIFIQKKPYFMK